MNHISLSKSWKLKTNMFCLKLSLIVFSFTAIQSKAYNPFIFMRPPNLETTTMTSTTLPYSSYSKGPSINYVTSIFNFFDPLSPLVALSHKIIIFFVPCPSFFGLRNLWMDPNGIKFETICHLSLKTLIFKRV